MLKQQLAERTPCRWAIQFRISTPSGSCATEIRIPIRCLRDQGGSDTLKPPLWVPYGRGLCLDSFQYFISPCTLTFTDSIADRRGNLKRREHGSVFFCFHKMRITWTSSSKQKTKREAFRIHV